MAEEHAISQQFCTFYLNGLFFGVEVEKVREVIRYQAMTRVPRAAAVIGGLINLRGQIVTAIDLRKRMEMEARAADRKPMNVVVRTDDGAVSLLVDEIGDVVEVSPKRFEPPPETLLGAARKMTCGVYKLDGQLLHAVDLDAVLEIDGKRNVN
jgi:purine-binding chemotaxis protein CheW